MTDSLSGHCICLRGMLLKQFLAKKKEKTNPSVGAPAIFSWFDTIQLVLADKNKEYAASFVNRQLAEEHDTRQLASKVPLAKSYIGQCMNGNG